MKLLKEFSVFLISALLLSSCSQPENSDNVTSGSQSENVSTSEQTAETVADLEDNPPQNSENGIIKTINTDFAQNFYILENKNILLVKQPSTANDIFGSENEDGCIIVYDPEIKEKLSVIPISCERSFMVNVQIVKDGFAVTETSGKYMTLYDNEGKETKTVNPPIYDSADYAVSYDKTRIACRYWDAETGKENLYTDSIDLNDKMEIEIFDDLEEKGAFKGIQKIFSYKDGIIAFSGTVIDEIDSKLHLVDVFGRCSDNGEAFTFEKMAKEKDHTEFLNTNLIPQENFFVVLEEFKLTAGTPSSGIIKYQEYEGGEIRTFTCENTEENHLAAVSDSGKYIATFIESPDFIEDGILKIYDAASGKLLHTENFDPVTSFSVLGMRFDEEERQLYAFFGDKITIIGF